MWRRVQDEEELSGGLPGWDEGSRGTPTQGSSPTSPTALERMWTIFSCGVATTLCPLISMMRCPTRTPPLSAIPPRMRLQICQSRRPNLARGQVTHPGGALPARKPTGAGECLFWNFPPPVLSSLRSCHGQALDVYIFVSTSERTLEPQTAPLCAHTLHRECTRISRHREFRLLSSKLSFGKKSCLGLSQSCQCFQTVRRRLVLSGTQTLNCVMLAAGFLGSVT